MGELQRRMSASEFTSWDAYVELYGPLDLRQRLDHAAARVAFTVAAVNGCKTPYRQFLDYPPPPPADTEGMTAVDLQIMGLLEQPGQNVMFKEN